MAEPTFRELVESITIAMPFSDHLRRKVDAFRDDQEKFRGASFKEMALRSDFLNPVLEELGWDPTNHKGKSYAEREVIQEDSLTIEGASKAPDYAFLLAGRRRFFVEAKRPAVNIAEGREAAFQIRRYCWSANLPFGLVTDFEEFAIYDCRAIPNITDSALVGRLAYFTFDKLEENWPLLSGMFGRENVSRGVLEVLASESKPPRGTRAIDTAFLSEIREWRRDLASDIAIRNSSLSSLEVNGAVQTLIDRIVFIRNAEARGLESEGGLERAVESGPDAYSRLVTLFKKADDRYNSGLFHLNGREDDPQVDRLGLGLKVSDELLGRIVRRLYFPEPYEFSVLPADILGRIYEQFLGEHITVDLQRKTTIELKPEFRKSGGVYYTPSPIVEYIVEETLGPLLKGKSPSQVEQLAIVDPAAGSGSFLIAAFQYLLNWHRDYYAQSPTNARKFLELGTDGQTRLNTQERKKVLLNNIYGVDIDPQAVEVAKLSLLLKVIEGQAQMELDIGRILPDLDQNIVCGNSLIGSDFAMPLALTPEEELRFNPFDWESTFPAIFARGGFDAVIGNPPYLNIDATWGRKDPRLGYLRVAYAGVYADKTDLLFYFLKKAADICRGETAFIVSRSFLEADKAQKLRGWLSEKVKVRSILDFRHAPVFPGVGINTAIIRFSKSNSVRATTFSRYGEPKLPPGYTPQTLRSTDYVTSISVPISELGSRSWNFGAADVQTVLAKIDSAGVEVGKILHVGEGMQTGLNKAFNFDASETRATELRDQRVLYTRARNSDISRYRLRTSSVNLLYLEDYRSLTEVPADVRKHLDAARNDLENRAAFLRGDCDWWRYTWPLHRDKFNERRIFCPYRASENRFALDDGRNFLGLTDTTVLYDNGQPEDLRYVLAFLNSRVLTNRFKFIGKLLGGGVMEYYENTVSKLPIPRSQPGNAEHDELVELVILMEAAIRDIDSTLIDDEQQQLRREIESYDLEIERHVQQAFGLTELEVELLERQVI